MLSIKELEESKEEIERFRGERIMETINVNGQEYILKESLDAKEKEKKEYPNLPVWIDSANVMVFLVNVDVKTKLDESEIIEMKPYNQFDNINLSMDREFIKTSKLLECKKDLSNRALYLESGTKISFNYVEQAKKVYRAFYGGKGFLDFEIFEAFELDEEKQIKVKKDFPVILRKDDIAFLLAPRVASGEN